jgi:hypothetical protein
VTAYDTDPRVTDLGDGTFHVDTADVGRVVHHVCPGEFGGYVTHEVGVDDSDGPGFDTVDEAIRSLIGAPQ